MMNLNTMDILAVGAHPDDIELACSGTLLKAIEKGSKVAILDLTKGELGSRGNSELRTQEAMNSARIMGVSCRHQLELPDGFFGNSEKELLAIIEQIRHFRPKIILANAPSDRHPDHGRASELVKRAAFLSGLPKIHTEYLGSPQSAFRPNTVHFYIQDRNIHPDFIVDISNTFSKKLECIRQFQSQFFDPQSKEPETPISTESFWKFLESRARDFGRSIQVEFGEGFISEKKVIGVHQIEDIY
jgi:bacillithiol biosynthesis deacetylase BshB1